MSERIKLAIDVAGHPEAILYFYPSKIWCGAIEDGVAFAHGNRGGWVISFADLESIYRLAVNRRRQQLAAGPAQAEKESGKP